MTAAPARAIFWLLRDVTLPALRRHRLRAVLTLVGVAIGVQLFVTIQLVNRATLRSFARTIETIAGVADLQLSNGDVGVSEDLVEQLAAVPGVASASALLRGTLRTRWGALTVFGVDLFGDQRVRESQFPRRHVHIADELRFANALDSIALSGSFAAEAALAEGGGFDVTGPTGTNRLVVRGTLDAVGPATLFGGAVGLVDLPTAQRLLARAGLVDEIDVAFETGADRRATTARLESIVAGHGSLIDPRQRVGGLVGMLGGLRAILAITSMLGLTVGALLVHHAMRSAVLQRRRALAIARALGYRRATVAAAVAVEAILFGLVGAAIGAGLAVGTARLAIDLVTGAISALWTRADRATVVLGLDDVALALGVGLVSALVAAAGPAIASARLDVMDQLRATGERRRVHLGWPTMALGLAACAVAGALLWAGAWRGSWTTQLVLILGGTTAMTFGYAVLAPVVLRALMRPIRALTVHRALGVSLASEHLARDPVRCRGTLGALMAAFAFVLCVSAFVTSLGETVVTWVDQALAADLYVNASPALPMPTAPTLPAEIETELRGLPGIADVTPMRVTTTPFDGRMIVLKAERPQRFRVRPLPTVARMSEDYLDAYARGDAVLVSDNLAFRLGLRAGDTVGLDSPSGRQAFRIGAVVRDYTSDLGTVIVDIDVYRRLWKDEQVSSLLVYLSPGADAARVRAEIFQRLSQRFPITVLTAGEFKRDVTGAIDDALVLTYAIELVAAVIAGIGVLSFFLVEVVDRRRDLGLLRTVALDRRQLLGSLTAEAMLIGACGGLLAIAWGWPMAHTIVTHSARMVSGWQLDFDFPWRMALLTPAVVALIAGVAAWLPVRAIARARLSQLVGVE